MKRSLGMHVIAAIITATTLAPGCPRAENSRRICASLTGVYYLLDGDFFDLGDAAGAVGAVRYEIARDIYFENSIGFFATEGAGVDVQGFTSRINVVAVFPVLIPYRPVARLGVGFMSVNPITVTPTQSFRPSQTAFYFCGGAGMTRSLRPNILVEMEASFWVTPYEYRIYRFDRYESQVTVADERFIHIGISLGAIYTF